jgi:hypothetical protein
MAAFLVAKSRQIQGVLNRRTTLRKETVPLLRTETSR